MSFIEIARLKINYHRATTEISNRYPLLQIALAESVVGFLNSNQKLFAEHQFELFVNKYVCSYYAHLTKVYSKKLGVINQRLCTTNGNVLFYLLLTQF